MIEEHDPHLLPLSLSSTSSTSMSYPDVDNTDPVSTVSQPSLCLFSSSVSSSAASTSSLSSTSPSLSSRRHRSQVHRPLRLWLPHSVSLLHSRPSLAPPSPTLSTRPTAGTRPVVHLPLARWIIANLKALSAQVAAGNVSTAQAAPPRPPTSTATTSPASSTVIHRRLRRVRSTRHRTSSVS